MEKRILVFGASGHVGGPVVKHIQQADQAIALRLVTSSQSKVPTMRAAFPAAEVVVANYFDTESLISALRDVDGVFVITPDFFDEITAMARLVKAIRANGSRAHIVRIGADTPGMSLDQLPRSLYQMGPGPAHQHFEAELLLEASGLPFTLLNSLGYFMDDFLIHFSPPLRAKRTLIIPFERQICFTDTRDLGAAAGQLLIEGPSLHAGRYYDFNSGEPPTTFRAAAELLATVTGLPITYDPSPEGFLAEVGPVIRAITGNERSADYFLENWAMERDHQFRWVASDFGEKLLGRPMTTLRAWMEEHRDQLVA